MIMALKLTRLLIVMYVLIMMMLTKMMVMIAGLHESLQPCSRAARKWRENKEMRRKWRENEEMERD